MNYRKTQSLIRRSGTFINPIKERSGFNPDHAFIEKAINEFLKNGGEVQKFERGPEYRKPIYTGSALSLINNNL